ncbi:MAG: GDSL family lipase [Candidatus Latescibacteria bacterium]|nr:GDSL family lipase [Candidatus Latescibacterota bacterium]
MQDNILSADLFEGHISLEEGDGWLKPWRLPHESKALFPSPDEGLLARAETASGVRLRFATESTRLELSLQSLPTGAPGGGRDAHYFDLTIEGELVASAAVPPGGEQAVFADLPAGDKVVELWLPQEAPVALRGLASQDGAPCRAVADERPRWVTYGSSLTHCVRAHSPSRIWPAIVARRHGLNLTSLGFGGQCHVDAQVGMVIAAQPADYITLKLGINCIGGSLSARTFPAAVLSLVQIIRARHPDTPIGLVSPIGYPPHETQPNAVGYTIAAMRRDIAEVHRRLVDMGDVKLSYFDGLEVFSLAEIDRYAEDQCHPDGDGIEVMAANFDRAVMGPLLAD